jgi:hypothetical protein
MKLSFQPDAFAQAVTRALKAREWSYGDAVRHAPFIDARMLSRAVNRQAQSMPVYLAVCAALDLDPFDYVSGQDGGKCVKIQPVTVGVSRETRAMAKRMLGAGNGG